MKKIYHTFRNVQKYNNILKRYKTKYIWFDFIVFNATFSNMSATSWRPVLVDYRSTRREPPTRVSYYLIM
jgi:hypothetical protein